jgi:hypothetical protein
MKKVAPTAARFIRDHVNSSNIGQIIAFASMAGWRSLALPRASRLYWVGVIRRISVITYCPQWLRFRPDKRLGAAPLIMEMQWEPR